MPSDDRSVHILATGGTIANPPDVDGYIPGETLVGNIPELQAEGEITVEDIASVGSSQMSPQIWFRLHERIEALSAEESGPDGVVITHGSNTLEETAYFLNVTLDTEIPVVLTGALRYHDTAGADGDRNLVDAVRTAKHPDARGRGVLVVLNDTIHHARDVTKTVSGRPDSWSSGDFGAIGLTDKREHVQFYRRIERRHSPNTEFSLDDVRPEDFFSVDIVYSAVGADGSAIRNAIADGTKGIVVAALPTGSLANPYENDTQAAAIQEARDNDIPVVISQRGYEGWPNSDLLGDSSLIWADTLSPQKAQILLVLGLGRTAEIDRLQEFFREY